MKSYSARHYSRRSKMIVNHLEAPNGIHKRRKLVKTSAKEKMISLGLQPKTPPKHIRGINLYRFTETNRKLRSQKTEGIEEMPAQRLSFS